ncbi:MAG: hypothetical protein EOO93_05395 [Pedobacter sp.]|nr:MAG: hypothetical protein EOO93_05395 [Pedobacter sp.]
MGIRKENSTNSQNEKYITECDLAYAVCKIGGRWKILILGKLENGKLRFSELRNQIDGITERMLTLQLRDLEKEGLVNDNVLSITSKNNKIYIATLGGISIAALENSNINFQNLSRKNGFPADYIYQVYAEGNNIWFGTDGKGLIKYTDGKFVVYNAENGLPARSVISITGSENDLWIGTSDDGFYRFDGKKFTKYQNNSKQKDYNIRSIVQISKNKLIIVHENGLDVINPQNNSVQTLREELGLQNTDPELNVWSRQDFDDYAGDYIFALGNKIVHYFDIENENINQPETRIKNVSLFLNPIPVNTTRFNHDENHISFDFIGLWYHHPEQVIYQVKLEGYDLDWVNTRDHFITYPSLPPGKYRFRVRSSATDNFENASEATYSFIVAKPFWKQAWFFIPLIVLFGTGIFFYMRYREKMLQKKANIARQNIEFQYETLRSQVNPHFLFNSFNTLAGVIETDQKMAVEYVEQLSDFFRNLLVYKDKDVITLQEELQLLENYFFLQKKRYSNNLQLQLNIGEKYKTFLLPPLCLQLLIENAIKHNIVSKDKPLNILVETGENILRVQNHFQPKAYMEKSTGIGLANIKNRYSILTKEQVKIVQDELFFTVEIPLLKP